MRVFCKMGAHLPGKAPVWNNGFYFSACAKCGRDLVRSAQDRWRVVPKGLKVVWRPRPEGYPDWSRLAAPEEARPRLIPRPASLGRSRTGLSSMMAEESLSSL